MEPLLTRETVVNLIANMTTKTGLQIQGKRQASPSLKDFIFC